MFSHTFAFCLDPQYSVGCPMEGCSCGLVSITLMCLDSLSEWGWHHPCPQPVPGKATSCGTDGILPGAPVPCTPRQFSGVHCTLLPELVEFGALSLLSHLFPFTSPFIFPSPFYFPLFFPLPSLDLCSFHAGENQPQPLICLICCSC